MPLTITAYTTFSANTKARSSEVNNNFSNHRGTLIPINSDTQTASDLTHDLGTLSHRWNVGYLGSLNLNGSTSTTNAVFQPNTGLTAGGLDILIGGNTSASFRATGIATSTVQRFSLDSGLTVSANSGVSTRATSSATDVTNLSITINPKSSSSWINLFFIGANTSTTQRLGLNTQTGHAFIHLLRGSSTICSYKYQSDGASGGQDFPPSIWYFFDNPGTSGSVTYKIQANGESGSTGPEFIHIKLGARIV